MQVVNVFAVELDEGPGRDGFSFGATRLGPALGADRIGAGCYEARADVPIWPYHYHYPTEEWLYVLAGAPVLRDAAGRRALEPGDVVCFPPGHRGAHTLEGPGRFLIVSAALSSGPFVSVYPDSDKVSIFPAIETGALNDLLLPRDGIVDYWHGEGRGPVAPATVTREPDDTPALPTANALHAELAGGDGRRRATLGRRLGSRRLDAAVLELDPGADDGPRRYEHGRERWVLAIAGTVTVETGDGAHELSPGELACLPDGETGTRRLRNRSPAPARVLELWTIRFPFAVCQPETGEWLLCPAPDAAEIRLRAG